MVRKIRELIDRVPMASKMRHLDKLVSKILEITSPFQGELHRPYIPESSKLRVQQVLDTTMVSTYGPEVAECEQELMRITNSSQVVLVSSGTVALETCLSALEASGKYVLCPSFTFAATANAIVNAGGIPFFYEVDTNFEVDFGSIFELIDRKFEAVEGKLRELESGIYLAGIVVVDIFGHIPELAPLKGLREDFNFFVVEDGAEALGSLRYGHGVGFQSDCAIVSFNGNKIVTAGGGGAILTNLKLLGSRCRELTNTAKVPHPYRFRHTSISSNLRMPALNAALLLDQLRLIDVLVSAKRSLHLAYKNIFLTSSEFSIFEDSAVQTSNFWLNNIAVRDDSDSDQVIRYLRSQGLGVRAAWDPLHGQAPYKNYPRTEMALTESLAAKLISLPSSPEIGFALQ